MGTRADFYVGVGVNAAWLGSVAWDGYLWYERGGIIREATDEAAFKTAVEAEIAGRNDGTKVSDGWPWPWNNSQLTDFSYCFDPVENRVRIFEFGHETGQIDEDSEDGPELPKSEFPDMTAVKHTTLGARSGLIVFGIK